jgi:hypothetical protein
MAGARDLVARAALLTAAATCSPAAPSTHPTGPLTPGPGAAVARIDVRQLDDRPRLTIVRRSGDPAPALVVAIAGDGGPIANTALAALLEERLEALGQVVESASDGAGLRLVLAAPPTTDALAAVFAAVIAAAARPVSASDRLAAVSARVQQLRGRALDGPTLAPLARCSAELGVLGSEPLPDLRTPSGMEQLEAWRTRTLTVTRTSVAVVGDDGVGDATLAALEDAAGWLPGAAPTAEPAGEDHHGAYLSSALAEGGVRLEVAMRFADAVGAVGAVKRLGGDSPLGHKLRALREPWRVVSLSATALPAGGCVRAALEPIGETGGELTSSAARAAATVRRELELQAARDTDPFVVTGEILGAGDAREAAARAAWWALSAPARGRLAVATALGLSARGKEAAPPDESALDQAYRAAWERAAVRQPEAIAERALAVEQGQGELWVLVASPCALADEGGPDAGVAALGALAVVAASTGDVTVEPWVSPDGIGVLAHGGLERADEPPLLVAERVARAAAAAFTRVPDDPADFAAARSALLDAVGGDLARAHALFAENAAPSHPSWLMPWGEHGRQLARTHLEVTSHWHDLLRRPVRVAVLANASREQADAAAREVDHWLLPDAAPRACGGGEPGPARAGAAVLDDAREPVGTVLLGTVLPPRDAPWAELAAALLDGDDGLLAPELGGRVRSWEARVVGGGGARALLVALRGPRSRLDEATERATAVLARLAARAPAAGELERARTRALERRRDRLRQPVARLEALWRGDQPLPEHPDAAAWTGWLHTHLDPSQLVVVRDGEEDTAP